ncbi:MAG: hypothetical protein H6563_00655 [Lewinellaceae bacterium]|nr:hypothetical protein [Lewinellaceae bacterium]
MQAVIEPIIDSVLDDLEMGKWTVEEVIATLEAQQPVLLGYFFSETFDVLTDEEKPFLLYLASVIWMAVNRVHPVEETIDQDLLDNREEANWELLNEATSPRFRDRLDPFFEQTDQEDLLAFIEDSLVLDDSDEDEWKLTKEGREPIFIGLKTMVDCLTK